MKKIKDLFHKEEREGREEGEAIEPYERYEVEIGCLSIDLASERKNSVIELHFRPFQTENRSGARRKKEIHISLAYFTKKPRFRQVESFHPH